MRVAQAQEIAASAKAARKRKRTIMPDKVPARTWVIAIIMLAVILLALFT